MAEYKWYSGSYIFAGNDYYIHKRKRDIGKAMGGDHMSDKDIAEVFSDQRERAVEASKTYYKDMFFDKSNVKLNKTAQKLLNSVFEDSTIDDIVSEIDVQLKQQLEKNLDVKNTESYLQAYQKSVDISQQLLSSDLIEAATAFNEILEALAQVSQLIGDPINGAALASALLLQKANKKEGLNYTEMGQRLLSAVALFEKQNPVIPMNSNIPRAVQAINRLGTSLSKNLTTSDTKISTKNISKVIGSAFQKGYAEFVKTYVNDIAEAGIDKSLAQIIGQGEKTTLIQFTDTRGKMTSKGGTKSAGKVDISLPNVQIHFSSNSNDALSGDMTFRVGISDKSYKNYGFAGAAKKTSMSFESGSGGTLKEALNSLFDEDIQHYLAYNVLAYGFTGFPAATFALHDIILSRHILRLFSTRGGVNDFSQYFLANGELFSMWEVLQYISENSVGYSQSQKKNTKNQAVSLHMIGREGVTSLMKQKNARIRVPNVNDVINRIKLTAILRTEKLQSALNTIK